MIMAWVQWHVHHGLCMSKAHQVDGAGFLSCSAFMSCWAFCAIMLPSICVSWAAFLAIAPMKSPNWIRVQVAQGSGWHRRCMVGTAGGGGEWADGVGGRRHTVRLRRGMFSVLVVSVLRVSWLRSKDQAGWLLHLMLQEHTLPYQRQLHM